MKKKIIIIILILTLLIISGCNQSSVADTYEMLSTANENSSTEAETTKSMNTEVHKKYSNITTNINIIKFRDTAEVKYKDVQKFDISVEDVLMGDNFFDIEKLSNETSANKLFDYLRNYDNNNICNADGTINQGILGVDRCGLFIKLKIKNDLNSTVDLSLGNLHLYNLKNENGKWSYMQISDCCSGIDKIQNYNSHCNFYDFQPNETQEIVLFFPIEKELITDYSTGFENGKSVIKNIKTDGPSMVDVYMNTNIGGTSPIFGENMNVLKLNIENGKIVN